MAEAKNPELARFIHTLIPIKGVDFRQPWTKIVDPINTQLKRLRLDPFPQQQPVLPAFSDLNNPAPGDPDSFDPFFVSYVLDVSKTPPEIRATAKLGLQAAYWQGLSGALNPARMNHIPYQGWQKFVVQPVFVKGSMTYLKPSNTDNKTIGNIQYGGDYDMIESARTRAFLSRGLRIRFSELDIPDEWLDEYIKLREKKNHAEEVARRNAVLAYRDDHKEEWEGLKKWFPKIDEIINRKQYYRFNFMDLAEELINEWAATAFAGSPQPHTLTSLKEHQQLSLADFFYHRINPIFGTKLFREGKFYPAVQGLGNITNVMYESAVESLSARKHKLG